MSVSVAWTLVSNPVINAVVLTAVTTQKHTGKKHTGKKHTGVTMSHLDNHSPWQWKRLD